MSSRLGWSSINHERIQRNRYAAAIAVCTRALTCWKLVPKCTRIDLRASKIQKFPGGGMPPGPPSCCGLRAHCSGPAISNPESNLDQDHS